MTEFVDVVIVGAGISGISAAWHLQDRCPDKSYVILERRENLGGTWDLFKYPGHALGLRHVHARVPVQAVDVEQAIADGPSILNYLKEAAAENGIDKHMRFGHKVVAADWSDADNRWKLTVESRRRAARDQLRVPVRLQRLLQLRRGLHARVRRPRGLRGHHRPPAALAGGPRLPGQEDRRHRQRRHRHHADPRADRLGRGPRHDAAALADLHRRRCPIRTRSPRGRTSACRRRRPTRLIRWKAIMPQHRAVPDRQALPELLHARRCARWPSAGCRRALTDDKHFSPQLQAVGPARVSGARTAICSRRSARARPTSSPTPSSGSPRPASS